MAFDVFFSYSSQDADWVKLLNARLKRFRVGGRALQIFFADETIRAGDSIPRALREALESSRFLVLVLSPAWLESEWCRLEAEVGIWRDPAARQRRILPLLLKKCNIPDVLGRVKYIDFTKPTDYEQSLRALIDEVRNEIDRSTGEEMVHERRAILTASILPWVGFGGPNFDFVWPEMIVDPVIKLHKHPGPELRLSRWLEGWRTSEPTCVAIVGEAGAGKSTTLRTMCLAGSDGSQGQRLLVQAGELAARMDSLVTRMDAHRPPVVLIDGLDEAGATAIEELGRCLRRLRELRVTTVIASRTDFLKRHYPVLYQQLDDLAEVVELCSWQDIDIMEFARLYSRRVDEPTIVSAVERILQEVSGARKLISNPMRLTLLLFLLSVGARIDAASLHEPYTLYRLFYSEWIKKERQRGTGGFEEAGVRSAHSFVAQWIYRNRGGAETLTVEAGEHPEIPDAVLKDSAFTELLDSVEEGDRRIVKNFRHETIGEFLIAQNILESFRRGGENIDGALQVTVVDDVNAFARSGMMEAGRRTVDRYLENLTERYMRLLEQDVSERIREQILYYIGRLPVTQMPDVLRQAFVGETLPLLRRSAALSAIVQGDHEIESRYLALLEDSEEARLNRSVQMVYFGDVNEDLHSFLESGEDWSRTRAAIFHRLSRNQRRDLRLRLWDLRTLRSFYASRGWSDALSPEEREILENVSLADPLEQREHMIREEHGLLMSELSAAGR